MKKAKALHVTFNSVDPIILVGDERGGVNSFKLSNSLRKGPLVYVPTKEEKEKMDTFLDSLDKHVY